LEASFTVMAKIVEKVLYGVSKPVIKTYTGTMLNMDVRKKCPFPAGAKIIAPNHPSTTDPFFIASMLGRQSFIMINDVLFHVPILGEYLRRSGHIPVIPGRGQEAIDTALEHLKAGHTIMIFPEGLISPLSGGFNKPRTGVARLALASGAPVFPVGIHLHKDRIRSLKSTVNGKEEIGHWYVRGPYTITVGKPMRFAGDVEDHDLVRGVAQKVMLKIMRLAYESEQRWNRNNKTLPGTFETV
jgi:1-acyl-sn-glycerol-3-phosphate acyltransferase